MKKLQSLRLRTTRMAKALRYDWKPLPPIHGANESSSPREENVRFRLSSQCSLNLKNTDLDHVKAIQNQM